MSTKFKTPYLFAWALLGLLMTSPALAQEAGAPGPPFQAAMTRAAERITAGRPIAAQWWLRRAFAHAQTPADQTMLREAFAIAAAASPLTANFGASIAPSDNINGGAAAEFFTLGDIQLAFGPASRALSGTEYAAQGELGYRLVKSANAATILGISVSGRSYSLSPAAQAMAPQVSGSDYATVMGEVALRQQVLLGPGLGPTNLSLHLGRVDYGRAGLYRYAKIAAGQDYMLGRGVLSLATSFEDQRSLAASRANAQVYDARIAYAHPARNGALWRWILSARKTHSALRSDTFHDVQAQVSLSPNWRLFGAAPTVTMGLGGKHYDHFILSFDGRRDRFASLGVSLMFEQVAIMGFSPVLSMTGTRTRSNIARYDTAEVKAALGVQSRF